jgi:hypothetical protein
VRLIDGPALSDLFVKHLLAAHRCFGS